MNLCSSAGATASTTSSIPTTGSHSTDDKRRNSHISSSGGGTGCGGGTNSNNNEMPPETRPKVVTVKHPESNKPKPTTKKSKPVQVDQDVIKSLQRCRDEGNSMSYNFVSNLK